ncbi:MAG: hypothetical protein ACD_39C00908G0001, partial [uncultured bacterium]
MQVLLRIFYEFCIFCKAAESLAVIKLPLAGIISVQRDFNAHLLANRQHISAPALLYRNSINLEGKMIENLKQLGGQFWPTTVS